MSVYDDFILYVEKNLPESPDLAESVIKRAVASLGEVNEMYGDILNEFRKAFQEKLLESPSSTEEDFLSVSFSGVDVRFRNSIKFTQLHLIVHEANFSFTQGFTQKHSYLDNETERFTLTPIEFVVYEMMIAVFLKLPSERKAKQEHRYNVEEW